RPTPADGHPIIGPVPGRDGVYVAVMHSGVTLAPGVAELVAGEVLEGAEADLLAPFRPDRFSG
ncbi:MAG: FAD-dependent oxidoreductase, partial [Paracoccaceae bacterium]